MRLSPLSVVSPLPTVPLALRGAGAIPLALEDTYESACEDARL